MKSIPFRIAALPDLMARDVIFAMTSGRASKMIRRTPIGQLLRSRIRSSSSLVFRLTLPTTLYEARKPCTTVHVLHRCERMVHVIVSIILVASEIFNKHGYCGAILQHGLPYNLSVLSVATPGTFIPTWIIKVSDI